MKIPHIKEFEDFYRKAWEVQNRLDLAANPKLRPNKEAKERRIIDDRKKELTAAAKTVNKLLHNGLTILEISDALGQHFLYIKKLVLRYDLPTVVEPENERRD
tara:strand:- start:257 stop:565 length:309 start_codon:yes stop_codon:yes gene_type:complete